MYWFSGRAVVRQILPRMKKGALQEKDPRHIFKDFKRLSAVNSIEDLPPDYGATSFAASAPSLAASAPSLAASAPS